MKQYKIGHMNFGPPSLSRLACPKCEEETIHKYGVCQRSGCGHRAPQYPVMPLRLSSSIRRGIKNAHIKITARSRRVWEPIRKEIIALLGNPKMSYNAVARQCGCSRSLVSKVAAQKGIMR